MVDSTELATGYISLAISTKGLGSSVAREFTGVEKQADKSGKAAGSRFGSGFGGTVKAALGAAAIYQGISAGVGFLKDANSEAREAQKVGAVTSQVIKATGGAAKISAADVGALSAAISAKSGMDDEAIQSGANLLLTFKNVRNEAGKGGKIFDRATQSAADLSAAGFGSVEGASKMLGKALNDPIKGISALGRAGVTFSEDQKKAIKKMVETGDTLGAQKIILGEVESQVGGVAEASATAGEKMSVAFGNFKEQVGTALLPVIDGIANVLTKTVIPALGRFVTFLAERAPAAFAKVKEFLTPVIGTVKDFAKSFTSPGGAGPAIESLAGKVVAFAKVAAPIVLDAFRRIADAAKKLFDVVAPIVKQVVGTIVDAFRENLPVIKGAVDSIKSIVVGVMDLIHGRIKAVTSAIKFIWSRFGDNILGVVKSVFGTIIKVIGGALKVVAGVVKLAVALLKGDWKGAWKAIREIVSGAFTIIKSVVKGSLGTVLAIFGDIIEKIRAKVSEKFAAIRDKITSTIRSARDTVKAVLGAGAGGLQSVFSTAVGAIGRIWAGLQSLAKKPISFIIDTVLNGGLIAAFNLLAGVLPGVAKIPRINLPGFATGGWTGPGSKYQPAGIVHADEYVINKESRRKIERQAPGYLDSLNGYAKGGKVVWPTRGRITSTYRGHDGVDINAAGNDHGDPIYAFRDGVITHAGYGRGYGNAVFERTSAGTVVYGHGSKVLVRAGQAVSAGQVIARVGSTGNSSGDHLHFGIPGGSYQQALALLRGASSGSGNGPSDAPSLVDYLGNFTKKIAGPLGKLGELGNSPLAQIGKAAVGKIKDSMLSKVKDVASKFAESATGVAQRFTSPGKLGNLSADQMRNAATIASVGSGMGRRAQVIGLITALVESNLQNVNYGDRDSLGLFQQRAPWGPRSARMNPEKSASMFFHGGMGGQRGLDDIAGWAGMDPGAAAQAVQVSAFPGRYRQRLIEANNIMKSLKYDSGGYLKPGATMTMNATRKPEPVLTSRQWATMSTLAERGMATSSGITINGPVYGATPAQMVAELDKQARRKAAVQIIR